MSSYPPPPDATDVLPGEDGGAYASRHAEAAAIADAARLPEWVLLAEIARRQRHGRAAQDDAALAERLWLAWHADPLATEPPQYTLASLPPKYRADWLRVAAEARAAIGESVGHVVLTDDEAWRMIESERLTTHRVLPVSVEDRIVARLSSLPDDADVTRAMGARLAVAAPDAFRGTMAIEERDLPVCSRCHEGRPCACEAYDAGLPDVTAQDYGKAPQ